jgi:hypothetical protein
MKTSKRFQYETIMKSNGNIVKLPTFFMPTSAAKDPQVHTDPPPCPDPRPGPPGFMNQTTLRFRFLS